MTEADTTKAAVIAMRSSSVRTKVSSGDMLYLSSLRMQGTHNHSYSCGAKAVRQRCFKREAAAYGSRLSPGRRRQLSSHPLHRHRNLGAVPDGLVDHAIALGEL